MAEGEFALVHHHLELALDDTARWVGDHDLYAMLVDVAAEQRDAVALAAYLSRAQDTAARYGHQLYQGLVHRARGVAHELAGEHVQAEAELIKAQEIFERLGTRFQLGRTLAERGELSRAQGELAMARRHFAQALEAFQVVGAVPEAGKTLDALRTLDFGK